MKLPEFTAEASLYKTRGQYRVKALPNWPGDPYQGVLVDYQGRRDAVVYPQQGCPWWHMAWCGPLIWPCATTCMWVRAFGGRPACISCMRGCVYLLGIPWLTFCDDCVGSFC